MDLRECLKWMEKHHDTTPRWTIDNVHATNESASDAPRLLLHRETWARPTTLKRSKTAVHVRRVAHAEVWHAEVWHEQAAFVQ